MSLQVVSMRPEHVAACGDIVEALELFRSYRFDGAAAVRLLRRELQRGQADLQVALDEGRVAGFAWFVERGAFDRSGYLRLIAVDPRCRGQGVGQRLLLALEQKHLQQGGIVLLASASNEPAHRFYAGMGYRQVGVLPGYVLPEMDEVIFFKPACS